jgi:hypothetical protein
MRGRRVLSALGAVSLETTLKLLNVVYVMEDSG